MSVASNSSGSISKSSDAALSNPADGQVLGYNATLAKWQNQYGSSLAISSAVTSNITASVNTLYPVDLSANTAITVTLPSAPANGSQVVVRVLKQSVPAGFDSNRRLSVVCGGSDALDFSGGPTQKALAKPGELVSFTYAGGVWITSLNTITPVRVAPLPTGSATTDTAALQDAINGLPAGGALLLDNSAGVYNINATLTVPNGRTVMALGMSRYNTNGPHLKAATASNLDAVIASSSWYSNGAFIDNGVAMIGLVVDPNGANQTSGLGHGIANMSFRGVVRECQINTAGFGTGSAGIVFGSKTRNGTDLPGGSGSETRIERCSVLAAGLHGIWAQGTRAQDFWLTDCVVASTTTGAAIYCERAAGSVISGNHVYGWKTFGIYVGLGGNTRIIANEIEPSSAAASTGNIYNIFAACYQGTIIESNTIWCGMTINSGNTYYGISVNVSAGGSNRASAVIANNNFEGWAGGVSTPNTIPLRINGNNSSTLYVSESGNNLDNSGNWFSPSIAGSVVFADRLLADVPTTLTATGSASDSRAVLASGTFTVTLVARYAGAIRTVKNTGSGTITVAPGSGTIDGAATRTIATQYASETYVFDGTNWFMASNVSQGGGGGGSSVNVVAKTASYTAANGDCVSADASGGAFVITSPPAVINASVMIKKADSSTNTVTFTPASGTVDGNATFVLTNQYDAFHFICDGTNWMAF